MHRTQITSVQTSFTGCRPGRDCPACAFALMPSRLRSERRQARKETYLKLSGDERHCGLPPLDVLYGIAVITEVGGGTLALQIRIARNQARVGRQLLAQDMPYPHPYRLAGHGR